MESDFFQIKLREKGDKLWSRTALGDVNGGVTVLLSVKGHVYSPGSGPN